MKIGDVLIMADNHSNWYNTNFTPINIIKHENFIITELLGEYCELKNMKYNYHIKLLLSSLDNYFMTQKESRKIKINKLNLL